MRERVRAIRFALREAWQISRRAWILSFVELVLSVVEGAHPLLYAMIIGGIAAGHGTVAVIGGSLLGLSIGTSMLISLWGTRYRVGLTQALADRFEGRTAQLLATLPTLAHTEDPDTLDDLQALRDRGGAIGMAYNSIMNALRWLAAPVTALVVAIGADWRLLLVAVAGIPQLLVVQRLSEIRREAEKAGSEDSRRSEALLTLLTDRSGAGEVRAFGARAFLRRRLVDATHSWLGPEVVAARRTQKLVLATTLLYFLVAVGVITWMGFGALAGSVTIAAMTIALTSIEALQSAFASIRSGLENLDTPTRAISRYLWLEDEVARETARHDGGKLPPERLHSGIRIRHATFTRPGATEPVIRDLSLDLPAGSTLALVGENGAGKSTLVNLLLGLYDLDSGQIEVDGVPLTELDLEAWRRRCAGAFQDHAHFEVSAQNVIGIGDLPRREDPVAAHGALEDAAATDVMTALPGGLSTQLGTSWQDGVELSGGQWQRLAIARGMMRGAPLLRVLDEPTAALDPATEDALFTRYSAAAAQTARTGGVTLLVTHRFSTVAAADRVVVLDGGQVIEQGSHAELLAVDGHYAELYSLQARGYA